MGDLRYLLEKYPEKPWNPLWLTTNPGIDLEFMRQHPKIKWGPIYFNPNVKREDLLAIYQRVKRQKFHYNRNLNLDLDFNFDFNMDVNDDYDDDYNNMANKRRRLDANEKVNFNNDDDDDPALEINDFVLGDFILCQDLQWLDIQMMIQDTQRLRPEKLSKFMELISQHSCINYDVIKSNPEYDWDWEGLSENLSINIKDILTSIITDDPLNHWVPDIICARDDVDLELFSLLVWANYEWFLKQHYLSLGSNFDKLLHICQNYPLFVEKLCEITLSKNLSWKQLLILKEYKGLKVWRDELYDCLPWKIIKQIIKAQSNGGLKKYYWICGAIHIGSLLTNPNISLNDCLDLLEYMKKSPKNRRYLNGSVDFKENCEFISSNVNLTSKIIEQNIDYPWQWSDISRNWFGYDTNGLSYKKGLKVRHTAQPILKTIFIKDIVPIILDYIGLDLEHLKKNYVYKDYFL